MIRAGERRGGSAGPASASSTSGSAGILDPVRSLEAMRASFERAAAANYVARRQVGFLIAGRTVELDCVGESLAEHVLAPLILNENREAAGPCLHIMLWDVQATGIAAPDSGERGLSQRFWQSDDGRFICHVQSHKTTWFDKRRNEIIGWIASANEKRIGERAKPLLSEISMWLATHGIIGTHAAIVGRDGRGVLLAGRGGSGKTTCALSCLRAGFEFLGDDHVWLERSKEGSFIGHGLYRSTALWPEHAPRFNDVCHSPMQDIPPTDRSKSCFVLPHEFDSSFRSRTTVRAIIVPSVGDQLETRFAKISKGKALMAIVPQSLIARYPVSMAIGLETLGQFVERTPCWSLQVGRAVQRIPPAIDEVLEEASGRA